MGRDDEAAVVMPGPLLQAFDAHDLDAVMEFFVDDCVLEMPRGPDPRGRRLEGRAAVRAGPGTRKDFYWKPVGG